MHQVADISAEPNTAVTGEFVTRAGERWYAIRNVDGMQPFFMNIVSSSDHWLFVSSTGGLTAGRVSPHTALFPYIPVDKIHENSASTGCKTLLRVQSHGQLRHWEPFNREHDGQYRLSRHLYKNLLGDKVCFEETNHDLNLAFRYTWMTSDAFGFVRQAEISNLALTPVAIDLLDGLLDVLAASTPLAAQTNASNLVNAHRWTELDEDSGLALYSLYSRISDRAEPAESLKANTVFCTGLETDVIALSSRQLRQFRLGMQPAGETHARGIRGAYLVNSRFELGANADKSWRIVADIEKSQAEVVALRQVLEDSAGLRSSIDASIAEGSRELARTMAAADAFQVASDERVTAHHYANVLFNVLRGGIFDDQHRIRGEEYARFVKLFNLEIYRRQQQFLQSLPSSIDVNELHSVVAQQMDPDLTRLAYEFLPVRFGRRHGDPSRPWNQFSIKLKDRDGRRLLAYEGNWRDIFQNWEALLTSYPAFTENVIAKFVNASTIDGYNPYRISNHGIDWEIEEPDDAWSNIGYWGDHQIIYLLKLLELLEHCNPGRLTRLLFEPIFSYANVPYRIKPFEALLANPKDTVVFDAGLARDIDSRVANIGADGRLVLDDSGNIYHANLLEKLLVPLLAKLGNFVIDGGIWLNTQRPEWNDANNALVGHGLSMVTLFYLRRYIAFLERLLSDQDEAFTLSLEVAEWLHGTAAALAEARPSLSEQPLDPALRFRLLGRLGTAASRYRETVYRQAGFSGRTQQPIEPVMKLLDDATAAIDHSIAVNRRPDGLYHSYNLLDRKGESAEIETLYLMLEGQVAALSSGAIGAGDAAHVVESLFDSSIYREDQHSFMLYPDRPLPGFLEKNRIPPARVAAIPLLQRLLADDNAEIIARDAAGDFRFCAEFRNAGDLSAALDRLTEAYGAEAISVAREPLLALFESVFRHRSFTGRSGAMFGFEGLGSVYWHMVAKLLLAVGEIFLAAKEAGEDSPELERLGKLYYRVRDGLGFNKSPADFGAFPLDPYSHTPRHAGARQPGMTGQVKEEILTRFAELGIRIRAGQVQFEPCLLRPREFAAATTALRYVNTEGAWQEVGVPSQGLAFTWCQVPIVYILDDDARSGISIEHSDGTVRSLDGLTLNRDDSRALMSRSGEIRQITVTLDTALLFAD